MSPFFRQRVCIIGCCLAFLLVGVIIQSQLLRCFLSDPPYCAFLPPSFFFKPKSFLQDERKNLYLDHDQTIPAFPRSQVFEEMEKQTWNQFLDISVNKPIIHIQPQDQVVLVNDQNSTLYIAGPLHSRSEKWMCFPETHCHRNFSPTSLSQYDFFEVHVHDREMEIFLLLINTQVEKSTRYHRIHFEKF